LGFSEKGSDEEDNRFYGLISSDLFLCDSTTPIKIYTLTVHGNAFSNRHWNSTD
jgi:hypothetical protein